MFFYYFPFLRDLFIPQNILQLYFLSQCFYYNQKTYYVVRNCQPRSLAFLDNGLICCHWSISGDNIIFFGNIFTMATYFDTWFLMQMQTNLQKITYLVFKWYFVIQGRPNDMNEIHEFFEMKLGTVFKQPIIYIRIY